jgi:hypothetical protein
VRRIHAGTLGSLFGRIFCGKPVPTPDQVRGRLFPENAPAGGLRLCCNTRAETTEITVILIAQGGDSWPLCQESAKIRPFIRE